MGIILKLSLPYQECSYHFSNVMLSMLPMYCIVQKNTVAIEGNSLAGLLTSILHRVCTANEEQGWMPGKMRLQSWSLHSGHVKTCLDSTQICTCIAQLKLKL